MSTEQPSSSSGPGTVSHRPARDRGSNLVEGSARTGHHRKPGPARHTSADKSLLLRSDPSRISEEWGGICRKAFPHQAEVARDDARSKSPEEIGSVWVPPVADLRRRQPARETTPRNAIVLV